MIYIDSFFSAIKQLHHINHLDIPSLYNNNHLSQFSKSLFLHEIIDRKSYLS